MSIFDKPIKASASAPDVYSAYMEIDNNIMDKYIKELDHRSQPATYAKMQSIFSDVKKFEITISQEDSFTPLFDQVLSRSAKSVDAPVNLFSSGSVRNRISIDVADLKKYDEAEDVCKKAIQLIRETNLDDLKLEFVLDIGSNVQKLHADHVASCMSLISCNEYAKCKHDIISLIDLMQDREDSILSKLFSSKDKKESESRQRIAEITERTQKLLKHLHDLYKIVGRCESIIAENGKIADMLMPYIVKCMFFADYKEKEIPNELFLSRVTGLMNTAQTLSSNKIQVETFKKTLIDAIDTFNHIVSVDMPQWLTNQTNKTLQQDITNKLKKYAEL